MEGQYDVAVVVVRKEFQEANPELVQKFLEQHEAATKKINEDKENSLKTINTELKKQKSFTEMLLLMKATV